MTPSTNLWYDGYIREDTHMDFNDAMTEAIELLEETARNADNAGEGHYAEHLNDIASALARKHWPDDYPTIDDITLEDAAAFAANAGMTVLTADTPEDIEAWPPATHVLGGVCYRKPEWDVCACSEVGPLFARQHNLRREMNDLIGLDKFPEWHVLWLELNNIGKDIAAFTVIDLA